MKKQNIYVLAKAITKILSNSACLSQALILIRQLLTQHVGITLLIRTKTTQANITFIWAFYAMTSHYKNNSISLKAADITDGYLV